MSTPVKSNFSHPDDPSLLHFPGTYSSPACVTNYTNSVILEMLRELLQKRK
jgi:hypothetical protein